MVLAVSGAAYDLWSTLDTVAPSSGASARAT